MDLKEKLNWKTEWIVRKYASDEDYKAGKLMEAPSVINGNLLLNEGITALLNLLAGETEDAFNNTNAYIGVGDSNTAAAASQTALQAATNKAYAGMESGYPSISGQTITFRAVFASDAANFSWQEFTVINAATDSGDNLNRKVSDQGTKASGQTWTVDVAITIS